MDSGKRKRAVRLLLVLAVVIGVASLALDFRLDTLSAADRQAARRADEEMGALGRTLEQLRVAEAGYVAQGQDPAAWMQYADDLLQTIDLSLSRFQARPFVSEARIQIDAATGAFDAVVAADARARNAVRDGQRLLAADAVFLEGAEAIDRVSADLAAARDAERAAADQAAARASLIRFGAHGAAIGLILLLAVLAGRLRLQPVASEAATMAQMLRELPPPVKTSAKGTAAEVAAPPEAAAKPVAPKPPTAAAMDLPATAELCTDLARVIDSRDVPALLARAARVLEARGVIIWVADGNGRRLEPVLTHGYSERVVRRLGTLAVDADNVTSRAFRSCRSQQLDGSGPSSDGALAVPLMTTGGCIGVLAAEVSHSRLAPEAVAMARIVAAQFATIIAPPGDGAREAAEA